MIAHIDSISKRWLLLYFLEAGLQVFQLDQWDTEQKRQKEGQLKQIQKLEGEERKTPAQIPCLPSLGKTFK